MAVKPPILIKEFVRLDRFIKPENIGFNTVSIESEKHFTVLEKDTKQVKIFHSHKITSPEQRNCPADFAIMHPTKSIMSVCAGTTVQMFDIGNKTKVADITLQQPIVYWKWANEHILAFVTNSTIYHFDLNAPNQPPRRVFDKHPDLNNSQIIGYKIDPTEKWIALIGLLQVNGELVGKIQLFSLDFPVALNNKKSDFYK